jgi:hypothetical protein
MVVRFALFFTVLAVLIGTMGLHAIRRAARTFGWSRRFERSLQLVLALGIVVGFGSRMLDHTLPELARAGGALGGAITLAAMIASVLLWPYELARFGMAKVLGPRRALWLGGGAPASGRPAARDESAALPPVDGEAEGPQSPSRRAVLEQVVVGSALSIGAFAGGYGTLFGRHDYQLEQVQIRLDKLPRALEGFRIVQLSDIHVGLFVGEPELRAAISLVERARPDAIVLTGDLLDREAAYAPMLGRFARSLGSRARHGVFAIPGNHDYYAGVRPVLQALREAGAEVLVNRAVRLGDAGAQLVLAGVDDVAAPRFGGIGPDYASTFRDTPSELARVLLSHNPESYERARHHADLVLSGHTHGGQITLFINPAELVLQHGLVRGHYTKDASQIYVNRGFGTAGPPARVGSPPEVTCLTLTT